MVSRVLVPMDESDLAEKALRYALEEHPEAAITVLHVVGSPSPLMGSAVRMALQDDVEGAAQDQAADLFDHARDVAAEYDIEIEADVAVGHPAKAVVDYARDYDVVIVGGHGGSIVDRLFVGNVAETVYRKASVPVTVVR